MPFWHTDKCHGKWKRGICQDINLNTGEHRPATYFASSECLTSVCIHFWSVNREFCQCLGELFEVHAGLWRAWMLWLIYQGRKQLNKPLKIENVVLEKKKREREGIFKEICC